MEFEKENQSDENRSGSGLRIWAILATLLFLGAAIFAWSLWSQNKRLVADNVLNEKQVDSLMLVKAALDRDLDSLGTAYSSLKSENESLQGAVARSENVVAQKAQALTQLRQQSSREVDQLQAQIAAMLTAKTEMETVISMLRSENSALKGENERLLGENSTLKGEKEQLTGQVGDLSKKLEDQIRTTHSAQFKATSFRVEVEKRGEKLTTKAKKVRGINVSFDLAGVPEKFQGSQKLYLVVTDEKATPVASAQPVKTTINAPAGPVNIEAQQVKQVDLGPTQRLSFNYKLDEKLKKGNYVVGIYSEHGLLGVSSFKLL